MVIQPTVPIAKKRYLERTVRAARSEADRELARMVVEADEGRWVPTAPMTMAELLDMDNSDGQG